MKKNKETEKYKICDKINTVKICGVDCYIYKAGYCSISTEIFKKGKENESFLSKR